MKIWGTHPLNEMKSGIIQEANAKHYINVLLVLRSIRKKIKAP